MYKVILYGADGGLEYTHQQIDQNKAEAIAIVNSEPDENDVYKYNIPVIDITEIPGHDYDRVIICGSKAMRSEMRNTLLDMGIDDKKILIPPAFYQNYDTEVRYRETIEANKNITEYLQAAESIFKIDNMRGYRHFSVTDLIAEHERPLKIEKFIEAAEKPYIGYVRLAALQLLAEQVYKHGIAGDMAELGVYRGWFAASMNELLPGKTLHLFDTFEGFPEEDIDYEKENDYLLSIKANAGDFSDTSVEYVLSQMKTPQNCIVHKGYFPDTADGLPEDVRFCLVSVDADIYKPVYAGLNYFYDRLSPGGYIMVHDVNQINKWAGVTEAVDRFCNERRVCFVPIPDECGSVIFTKFT